MHRSAYLWDTYCDMRCALCRYKDCHTYCSRYVSRACREHESAPYVCNTCRGRGYCKKERYVYSAKYADAAVKRRRSESRSGIRISDAEKEEMDVHWIIEPHCSTVIRWPHGRNLILKRTMNSSVM